MESFKPKAEPRIAFLLDERVSHERISLLKRTLQELQVTFEIDLIKPGELPEAVLLSQLTDGLYDLIALPFYRYASSAKLEAALHSQKSQAKLFGYFCEPLPRQAIEWKRLSPDQRILLDFEKLEANELSFLIGTLLNSELLYETQGYQDDWYENRGIGYLLDHVFLMPELRQEIWQLQAFSIRLILCALWGIIYERPFFRTQTLSVQDRPPKASFFCSVQAQTLTLQLIFRMGGFDTPQGFLERFWPLSENASVDLKILQRASDFLQVHWSNESNEIRMTAGLFATQPKQQKDLIKSLLLSSLPGRPLPKKSPLLSPDSSSPLEKLKHDVLRLEAELVQKNAYLLELKRGGIGSALSLPPPDAESLLDAFQSRYIEAKTHLKELEAEIQRLQLSGEAEASVQTLRNEMTELAQREREWIKRLAQTLLAFKDKD